MAIPYERLVAEDLNLGYGTLAVTMPGGGSATGTKVGSHTFFDTLHIRDFGGLPNGTDTTPAFNAALAVAATFAGGSVTIRFAPGQYRFASKPNRIGTGVTLEGNGSAGTTSGYGTRLQCDYAIASPTEGFLEWDGSGPSAGGAGGGFENLQIYRSPNFSGGTAVKLYGSGDNFRAGFWKCDKFVIATSGSSTWNRGIMVDGTNATTSGTKGIREVRILNGVIASCSDVDSNIYLYNSVHFYGFGLHLIPSVAATCGMTVTSSAGNPSTNIFLASCNVDGNITLDYVLDFCYFGRIGANFTITANSNNVSVHGAIHGTRDVAHSNSVNLFLDEGLILGTPIYPMFDVTFPYLSGVRVEPLTTGQGADLLRGAALAGATGTPLGLSNTAATGGSGQPYIGYNQNQNAAGNNATYYRAAYPAFRFGNPFGNGTYPIWEYVAPAGVAGDAITYVNSRKVHGTSGVNEFPAGLLAGDSGGSAFAFTVLTNTSTIDPGNIVDGAISTANLTVTGAAMGDTVVVSFTGITTAGWVLTGHVTSAGNVKVEFLNKTGAPVDLPSGTLRADVIHHL